MQGKEHWTRKGDVKLFLWQKAAAAGAPKGTLLFVHGSSMGSQPTFDLQVPGRPHSSVMEWFAERGFHTWCMDNEGYGRSDKSRPINCFNPSICLQRQQIFSPSSASTASGPTGKPARRPSKRASPW